MSKRATEIIGKPVVSADSGEKLGTVSDLLLDDTGTGLVGFVLRHGMLKSEKVLPADAVMTLGVDAVVSRTTELVEAKAWREQQSRDERPFADHTPRHTGAPVEDAVRPLRD